MTTPNSNNQMKQLRQFAEHGFDLVIVAESDRIHTAATELKALGTNVDVVQTNLAEHEGMHKLLSAINTSGRPVDAARSTRVSA